MNRSGARSYGDGVTIIGVGPWEIDTAAVRRRIDTSAVVATCLFCTMMAVAWASASGRTPGWNHISGFVLASIADIALVWRYRYPWQVLSLAILAPLIFETDGTAALFALFALARSIRGPRLVIPTIAVYVACAVSLLYDARRDRGHSVLTVWVERDDHGSGRALVDYSLAWWIPFLAAIPLVALALTLGLIAKARSDLTEAVASRDRAAAGEDALREEVIRSEERRLIARRMHDTIAQRLSRISLAAGGLQVHGAEDRARVANAASLIHSSASEALQDLRDIVGVLRGDGLPERDTPGATMEGIDALIAGARQAGLRVLFTSDLAAEPPGRLAAKLAYDTVRECITNAQKYAPDQPLRITITGSGEDGLLVQVRNPRPPGGYAEAPGSGSGLSALAADAAEIGGSLQRSGVAEFRVRVWAPWHS